MVKRKRKVKKKIPPKIVFIPDEETGTSLLLHPNATLTPEASLESPTSAQWLPGDSTSAPKIAEESDEEEQYAQSYPALIEKYILSRHFIPFLLAIVLIGYVFIQDNAAGNLRNWSGIWWTIQKSGILLALLLVVLLCQFLYKKIFGREM